MFARPHDECFMAGKKTRNQDSHDLELFLISLAACCSRNVDTSANEPGQQECMLTKI